MMSELKNCFDDVKIDVRIIKPHETSVFQCDFLPVPFIRPCHFCGVDVEMQKDQTEGRAVACFDHSYKFTPKVKR